MRSPVSMGLIPATSASMSLISGGGASPGREAPLISRSPFHAAGAGMWRQSRKVQPPCLGRMPANANSRQTIGRAGYTEQWKGDDGS